MAFNGSGTFNRIYNWVQDKTNGIKINATRMDSEFDGIAAGLSNCITKDGQTTITADLPFNGRKITGLGNAAADTDALNRVTGDGRYWRMAQGSDIASAATTDIGAAAGTYVKVTGTTTITSLGTVGAGTVRIVTFTGALTLTHNATSLILPGGVNITTTAGDVAEFVSEGSGNWRCTSHVRAIRPAFSATKSTNQAVGNGTSLVTWDETLDTSNALASNRFTAAIAGTYFFHAHLTFAGGTVGGEVAVQIRKNGVTVASPITSRSGAFNANPAASIALSMAVGDYVEVYAEMVGASGAPTLASSRCGFSGFLIG